MEQREAGLRRVEGFGKRVKNAQSQERDMHQMQPTSSIISSSHYHIYKYPTKP